MALCFQGGGSFPTEKVKRTGVTRLAFCAKVDVFYKNAKQGSPIIYKHMLHTYPKQSQGRTQDLNLAKQKYKILTGHKNRY